MGTKKSPLKKKKSKNCSQARKELKRFTIEMRRKAFLEINYIHYQYFLIKGVQRNMTVGENLSMSSSIYCTRYQRLLAVYLVLKNLISIVFYFKINYLTTWLQYIYLYYYCLASNHLANHGRRHFKLFANCHVSWDTLYLLEICKLSWERSIVEKFSMIHLRFIIRFYCVQLFSKSANLIIKPLLDCPFGKNNFEIGLL